MTLTVCPISSEWRRAWPGLMSGVAAGDPWCSSAGRRYPLCGAFFEAVQQAEYGLTKDVNGYRQEGFAAFDRTIYRGRRLSAARAPIFTP